MSYVVANGSVVTVEGVLPGVRFSLRGDHIAALDRPAAHERVDLDLDGGWLVPGFIDTQVNGGGGVLFNDAMSIDAIDAIGRAHAGFGTTAFLPTLITDTPDRIAAALDAVDEAIEASVPGVVGIHLEGPFINANRRGIHELDRIRRLDRTLVELLTRPRAGKVLVTLAPEQCDLDDIRALVGAGVIVSCGHSDATYETVTAAIEAGVTGFTHLFNAMSRMTHRAPGAVGAALDSAGVYCGLIVDNVHLHPAAVRIAITAKSVDNIMLVTDAMPSVGTDAASFMLQGKSIAVSGGICTYEDGTLAGSDLDMASALRNVIALTGLELPQALAMAAGSPAAFLGLTHERGILGPGKRADWVWLDAALRVRGTWIGSRQVAPLSPEAPPGIAAGG